MSTWFLLADRPGWRSSSVLSTGVVAADAVRLGELPRSVLDCPPVAWLDLPCCERAELRPDRSVALLTGTGQVRAVAGPWRHLAADDPGGSGAGGETDGDAPAGSVEQATPTWRVPADGCGSVAHWPTGTWQPTGLVALPRHRIGVLDRAAGLVHVVDHTGAWRRALAAAQVPGCPWPEGSVRYRTEGALVTEALDSGLPGCRWHRVVLGADVPEGTHVRVEALVTDADLSDGEVAVLDAVRWAPVGVLGESAAAWDALVIAPRGRYLRLRLTLRGDGAATPAVADVEVHLPRRTSLRHLPAVHASGPTDVLDRYLALTDTVRGSVVAHLEGMQRQLDPRAADAAPTRDFLAWLGQWVGMVGMGALPVARRRRLVAAAAALYHRRGTPDGVARHVELWLGRPTAVLEHYRLRRWAVVDQVRLGDATRLFGRDVVQRLRLDGGSSIGAFRLVSTPSPRLDPFAVYAHRFTLLVRAREGDDAERLAATAARVLAAVRPAHTVSSVSVVTPTARVGEQATLGLDAVVAGPPPAGRLGDRLGIVLARDPRRSDLRSIGIDARVGTRAG